jgi:hypothetical protein
MWQAPLVFAVFEVWALSPPVGPSPDPACFACDADMSVGCQDRLDFTAPGTEETDCGQVAGGGTLVFTALWACSSGQTCMLGLSSRASSISHSLWAQCRPVGAHASGPAPDIGVAAGADDCSLKTLRFAVEQSECVGAHGCQIRVAAQQGSYFLVPAALGAVLLSAHHTRRFWLSSLLPAAGFVICARGKGCGR